MLMKNRSMRIEIANTSQMENFLLLTEESGDSSTGFGPEFLNLLGQRAL
jgi:hypothetical protein